MRINWSIRLKNKLFLAAIFSFILKLINQVASIYGYDLSEFSQVANDWFETITNVLVLAGIITDPTVFGMNDSNLSMNKTEPTAPNQDLTIKGKQEIDDNTEILADNTDNTDSTNNEPPKSNAEEF
ncbi:phage holin [Macrococcoides goetzii]|nr:phage holin [Macrococcus goetzii]TDM50011.1 phage holin [Macrococcus goetzii]